MINSDNQNNINLKLSKYQEKSVRQALPMDGTRVSSGDHHILIYSSSWNTCDKLL